MLKKNLFIAISLLALTPAARAAGPVNSQKQAAPVSSQALTSDSFTLDCQKSLKIMENRFFFHDYDHDPIEKRLERLELLVLGGAQSGQNKVRLDRLKAMVHEKDAQAAKDLQTRTKELKEKKSESGSGSNTGATVAESQYPVLNTLEWRALKKTYKGESLDKRLERLETGVFGLPATSMSYADRVDRLKKVIGVEQIQVNNKLPGERKPIGPPPRAEGQLPFDQRTPIDQRTMIIEQMPMGMTMPGPEFKDLADSTMHFRKIFDQMQKMMNMMPGMPGMEGMQGMPGLQGFGIDGNGNSMPLPNFPLNRLPQAPRVNGDVEETPGTLPPYVDPNSI